MIFPKDTRKVGALVLLVASVIGLSCLLTGAPVEFGGDPEGVAPVVTR